MHAGCSAPPATHHGQLLLCFSLPPRPPLVWLLVRCCALAKAVIFSRSTLKNRPQQPCMPGTVRLCIFLPFCPPGFNFPIIAEIYPFFWFYCGQSVSGRPAAAGALCSQPLLRTPESGPPAARERDGCCCSSVRAGMQKLRAFCCTHGRRGAGLSAAPRPRCCRLLQQPAWAGSSRRPPADEPASFCFHRATI